MTIEDAFDKWVNINEKSRQRAKVEYHPEPGSRYLYDLEHGGAGCCSVTLIAWYSVAGDPGRKSSLPGRSVIADSATGAATVSGNIEFPVGAPDSLCKYNVKIKKRN